MAATERPARSWVHRLRRAAGGRLAQRVLGKRLFCLLRYGRSDPNTIGYWDGVYAREGRSAARLYPELHRTIAGLLRPGMRVLDAGCGPGHLTEACRQAGCRVAGLDFSLQAMRICRGRGLAGCVGDLTNLPFADGAFDAVILSEVIEHLADPRSALCGAARLLRPGGLLLVTVPNCPPGVPDTCIEHLGAFDADSLRRLLAGIRGLAPQAQVTQVCENVRQPDGDIWHHDHLLALAAVRETAQRVESLDA